MDISTAQVVEMRESGQTLEQIAAAAGCSVSAVWNRLKQAAPKETKPKNYNAIMPEAHDRPEYIAQCLHCKAKECRATGRGCSMWRKV